MTLAILLSLKSMEMLENGLQIHSGASSQSCHSVDADAWCKRALSLKIIFCHSGIKSLVLSWTLPVQVCSHRTKFSTIFITPTLIDIILYLRMEFRCKWIHHLFSRNSVPLIQVNIGGTISGWLNFDTCKHTFTALFRLSVKTGFTAVVMGTSRGLTSHSSSQVCCQ